MKFLTDGPLYQRDLLKVYVAKSVFQRYCVNWQFHQLSKFHFVTFTQTLTIIENLCQVDGLLM